jgi:hypothetical protein
VFSLPDITKMRVNTKVHESMIDKLRPGLRARIKVESFGDKTLLGQITKVQPLPDVAGMFASDVKVYTTHVAIDTAFPGLRPGMSAQVEILVEELKDVLSIPLQAVLQFKDKDHIAVKSSSGKFDWREVTLGTSNDKLVEVKKGIAAGELVALNPTSLMSEEEKREAFGSSGKDTSKKEWGEAKKVGTPGAVGKGAAPGQAVDGDPKAKAKAKGKGMGKGARGGPGGGGGGMMGDPAAFQKLMSAPPEEQRKMLEERGVPPERIDAILERMKNGGGGPPGGGGGFGGPGGQP